MNPPLLKSSEYKKCRGVQVRTRGGVLVCRCPDLYFVKSHHGGVALMFREKHEKFSSTETLGEWPSDLDTILALDSADAVLTGFGKHLVEHDEKTLFDFRPYLAKITQELYEASSSDDDIPTVSELGWETPVVVQGISQEPDT